MNNLEIYKTYLEAREARMTANFPGYASLAIEDTAYELDISINKVVKAISEHDAFKDGKVLDAVDFWRTGK